MPGGKDSFGLMKGFDFGRKLKKTIQSIATKIKKKVPKQRVQKGRRISSLAIGLYFMYIYDLRLPHTYQNKLSSITVVGPHFQTSSTYMIVP